MYCSCRLTHSALQQRVISELGLNSYEPALPGPAMDKSVKKLLTGSLAKKNFSGDVCQQHSCLTYDYCFTMLGSYGFIFMQEE